jgi:hypothetical protein
MLHRLVRFPSGNKLPALVHVGSAQGLPSLACQQQVPKVAESASSLEEDIAVATQQRGQELRSGVEKMVQGHALHFTPAPRAELFQQSLFQGKCGRQKEWHVL